MVTQPLYSPLAGALPRRLTQAGGSTAAPTGVPVNTSPPSLSGIYTENQVLSVGNGAWTQSPTSYLYQHQQSANGTTGWTDIVGATTNPTGAIPGVLVGLYLRAGVKGVNSFGAAATWAYGAAVGPIAAVLAISGTPGAATNGTPYSFTPSASGGHTTYVFSLTGTLPTGLSFNTATGAITGTPTVDGTTSGLNITVTDADGLTAALGAFSITVSTGGGGAAFSFPLLYLGY